MIKYFKIIAHNHNIIFKYFVNDGIFYPPNIILKYYGWLKKRMTLFFLLYFFVVCFSYKSFKIMYICIINYCMYIRYIFLLEKLRHDRVVCNFSVRWIEYNFITAAAVTAVEIIANRYGRKSWDRFLHVDLIRILFVTFVFNFDI